MASSWTGTILPFFSVTSAATHSLSLVQPISSRVEKLSNGSLLIPSVEEEDAGVYTCVSSNMAGSGNASITLHYLGL